MSRHEQEIADAHPCEIAGVAAVRQELGRGGQVYVVHNRVHSIDRLTHHLRELVPEARFGIGHGQMDEEVLEEVILGFIRNEFDVRPFPATEGAHE